MDLWGTASINTRGHLEIGGCDATELVKEYGTPLYVMDEHLIRQVCGHYRNTIKECYGNGMVLYASKAFLNTAMCKIIEQEGLGLDVVSAGELFTALKAGFPVGRIYMHGNNKTYDEIEMAVNVGIGCIVIDSASEVNLIRSIAKRLNKKVTVSVRVKPGIEAHTHHYIQTGQIDSKFGLGIEDGQAMEVIKTILEDEVFVLKGIHCHIGSQIFELRPYKLVVGVMTDFMLEIKNKMGFELAEINFGGGFGIRYIQEDLPLRPNEYVKALAKELIEQCQIKSLRKPDFVIEPGRSIVGEAGLTLYTVGVIKEIPDVRKYISVDGGMTDNPRPALYQAKYQALLANKANGHRDELVSVAGKCCESGDMLIWDVKLPKVQSGDILAVFSTGAYNYSMASNYNKTPIPAVVLVNEGKSDLMVRRQSYEDLVRNDTMPKWLRDE